MSKNISKDGRNSSKKIPSRFPTFKPPSPPYSNPTVARTSSFKIRQPPQLPAILTAPKSPPFSVANSTNSSQPNPTTVVNMAAILPLKEADPPLISTSLAEIIIK